MDSKMKRRDFLKISALAGVAVVAAACAPTATPTAAPTVAPKATAAATTAPKATAVPTTAPTAAPKATEVPKATEKPKVGFQGEIELWAEIYTPSSALTNPDPKAPKREAMAILAKEWMALHPGIKMTFFTAPTTTGWIDISLIGGTGPDMFVTAPLVLSSKYADDGKVVILNDYLELPNKYTPEETTPWKNTFKDPFLSEFSIKGNWGAIPLDLIATGVYCNVDMFKSVGIDLKKEIVPELGSPKDWATMISWCKKIKEAGYIAFYCGYFLHWWLQGVLADQLFWQLTPTFDVLNYHANVPKAFQGGVVSQEELVHQYVCKGWKAFSEPATRTMFEIHKELFQYMPVGVEGLLTYAGQDELFLTGQLAMNWGTSGRLGQYMQDARRKFEFSTFWLPPVTKATTPLAKDPPILPAGVGGYGSKNYCINHKCVKKGNVEECVDWLMFISTPAHDEMIVNEVPSYVPAQKKAKSLPEVENLFVGETRLVGGSWAGHPWKAPCYWGGGFEGLGSKYFDTFQREESLYLLGDNDLDTFMTNADAAFQVEAPDLIRAAAIQYTEKGDWDLTQWSCTPKV